jgi:hypothetical protein
MLNLEQNAMDSLVHGVEHFINEEKPSDLKYTILHVFHAVELFLKARLAKDDPSSILKPHRANHTIDFDTCVKKLKTIGVDISEQNRNNLNALRNLRNFIEHYQIACTRNEIVQYLGRAMFFLDSFLQRELGINLKEQLDEEIYRVLSEALYTYNELLEKANEQMMIVINEINEHADHHEPSPHYSVEFCVKCGEKTILISDRTLVDGSVQCFFCKARSIVETCERCGSFMLYSSYSEVEEDDPNLCEDCWHELNYQIVND